MKLLQVQLYVRYNTANNVANFGGDPVTQLIVNVYQMIKLYSLVTQQIHWPYQPKQSPSQDAGKCI